VKMRTPAGVAYRYKNIFNRICLCCRTGGFPFPDGARARRVTTTMA
jgi:hypothetical protein